LTALLRKVSKPRVIRRVTGGVAAAAFVFSLFPALPCHAACHLGASQEGQAPAVVQVGPATTSSARVFIGVFPRTLDEERAAALGIGEKQGVYVMNTVPNSPAERGGLKKGDVIVAFNGQPVANNEQFRDYLRTCEPGKAVTFDVIRDKKRQTVTVVPDQPEAARSFTFSIPGAVGITGTIDPEAMRRHAEQWRKRAEAFRGQAQRMRGLSMGYASPGRLGVRTQNLSDQLATYFGVADGGVLVTEVVKGSAAEKAGVQAGDCIVRVGETAVHNPNELSRELRKVEAGTVNVTVVRNKQTLVLTPTLEKKVGVTFTPGQLQELSTLGGMPGIIDLAVEASEFAPLIMIEPGEELDIPDAPQILPEESEGPVATPVIPTRRAASRVLAPARMPAPPRVPQRTVVGLSDTPVIM
jgi:membrane-associated protease RseP (regulator of RpoE activity)